MKEKVDPYLRPLYDALNDIYGTEQTQRLIERGTIEIAPLAYMRGRTLDDAFVILDEAQNTTHQQMKMFLTRLGFGSKWSLPATKHKLTSRKHGIWVNRSRTYTKVCKINTFPNFGTRRCCTPPNRSKIIKAYEEQQL